MKPREITWGGIGHVARMERSDAVQSFFWISEGIICLDRHASTLEVNMDITLKDKLVWIGFMWLVQTFWMQLWTFDLH